MLIMAKHFLTDISITFVDLNKDTIDAFQKVFVVSPKADKKDRYKNMKVVFGDIKRCDSHDCIVSPANSFGLMDGGIDEDLTRMLGKPYDCDFIGRTVRKVIEENYYGEQPVGTCILLETENERFPFLAHAPTMRNPKPVPQTLNAYHAFKAVLQEVVNYNKTAKKDKKIRSILTTTFCTGCGKIPIIESLRQMKMAFDVVHDGVRGSWDGALNLCHHLDILKDEACNDKSKMSHLDLRKLKINKISPLDNE